MKLTKRITKTLAKPFNRLSARTRIAMGQMALLVSVMMLAVALGLMPSTRDSILDGRAKLCESIAISSSVLATRNDVPGMQAALSAIVARDKQIISAAVRDADKNLVVVVGQDHEINWRQRDRSAAGTCVYVPIYSNEKSWGTVEMVFRPVERGGFIGLINRPSVTFICFVSAVAWILFHFYLRKTLRHLDPSKVVPGRVRS